MHNVIGEVSNEMNPAFQILNHGIIFYPVYSKGPLHITLLLSVFLYPQAIVGADTTYLVQVVRTSINTTLQLLSQARLHTQSATSILEDELKGQRYLINSSEKNLTDSSLIANVTMELSSDAHTIVENLTRNLSMLPQNARDEIEATRSYVSEVEAAINVANISLTVDRLRVEIERQAQEREQLQVSVSSLQCEVDSLRELASSIPDCRP